MFIYYNTSALIYESALFGVDSDTIGVGVGVSGELRHKKAADAAGGLVFIRPKDNGPE